MIQKFYTLLREGICEVDGELVKFEDCLHEFFVYERHGWNVVSKECAQAVVIGADTKDVAIKIAAARIQERKEEVTERINAKAPEFERLLSEYLRVRQMPGRAGE